LPKRRRTALRKRVENVVALPARFDEAGIRELAKVLREARLAYGDEWRQFLRRPWPFRDEAEDA
jgi:hypothetical protein